MGGIIKLKYMTITTFFFNFQRNFLKARDILQNWFPKMLCQIVFPPFVDENIYFEL